MRRSPSLLVSIALCLSAVQCDIGHQSPYNFTSPSYLRTTSGVMPVDEVWSGEIQLTGDITVPFGVTLTIEPGTVVRFAARSDDQHWDREFDPGDPSTYGAVMISFLVYGSVLARGTAEEPIMMMSSAVSPDTLDWGGIELFEAGHVFLEQVIWKNSYQGIYFHSRSTRANLKYCSFEDITCRFMAAGEYKLYGPVNVEGCRLIRCGRSSIEIRDQQNIAVRGSVFYRNETALHIMGGSAVVENNLFIQNVRAVRIHEGAAPLVRRNRFSGHSSEAVLIDSDGAVLSENNFIENTLHVRVSGSGDVQARDNWWGSADSARIEALIHHYADEPGLGEVHFRPFAETPWELNVPAFDPPALKPDRGG